MTHNLMAMITCILAFGYFCMNLPKLKDKNVRANLLLSIVFILCITAFYWLPLFETSISTKYAVYEDNVMSSPEALEESALDFNKLIVTPNNSAYVREIGPHILIMLCFSVAAFRQVDSKYKKEYIFFLGVSLLSLIMSTKLFPWKFFEESMQLLQFAWRMLVISNFCLAIVCSINMGTVIKNFKFRDAIIISVISICYICALKSFVPTTDNLKSIEEWNMGLITGKEGETSAGMGKGEYLPYNAYEDKFYIASREDGVLVLEGTGLIESVKKDGNKLTCKLESVEDNTVFEFPYIYYPGYVVTIDGSKVDCFEDENGFLAIAINTIPMSDIVVEYKGTSLMSYSKVFSIISVISLFMVIYINKKDHAESEEVSKNS